VSAAIDVGARATAGLLWRTARLPWVAGPAARLIGATAMTKAAGLQYIPQGGELNVFRLME
jgi:hypothetical protein